MPVHGVAEIIVSFGVCVKQKMVFTTDNMPICRRMQEYVLALWGFIYLFFATIFVDPKKMNQQGS